MGFFLHKTFLRYVLESEDSDGWETVQRKTKPHGSPSQRSLENLATVAKEHHKLTRSVSEPNATGLKYMKRTNNSKYRNHKDSKTAVKSSDSVGANIPNGDISIPPVKTDGKDSDKENQVVPVPSVKISTTPTPSGVKSDSKKLDTNLNKAAVIPKAGETSSGKKGGQDSVSNTSKPLHGRRGSGRQGDASKTGQKAGKKSPAIKEDSKKASSGTIKKGKHSVANEEKRKSTESLRKSLESVNESIESIEELVGVGTALTVSDDESAEKQIDDVRNIL